MLPSLGKSDAFSLYKKTREPLPTPPKRIGGIQKSEESRIESENREYLKYFSPLPERNIFPTGEKKRGVFCVRREIELENNYRLTEKEQWRRRS